MMNKVIRDRLSVRIAHNHVDIGILLQGSQKAAVELHALCAALEYRGYSLGIPNYQCIGAFPPLHVLLICGSGIYPFIDSLPGILTGLQRIIYCLSFERALHDPVQSNAYLILAVFLHFFHSSHFASAHHLVHNSLNRQHIGIPGNALKHEIVCVMDFYIPFIIGNMPRSAPHIICIYEGGGILKILAHHIYVHCRIATG